MSDNAVNPAVQVAQEIEKPIDVYENEIITLSTGVRAKLHPVSSSLILKVIGKVKDPPVPKWLDPDKGRETENPGDPAYLAAIEEANMQRGIATMDAVYMFGFELVDPIPDNGWDEQLSYLGIEFDPKSKLDREMAYKRYIAIPKPDLQRVMAMSGISQGEVIAKIGDTFPDKP